MTGAGGGPTRQAQLTFAMARHAAVDLTQVFNVSPHAMAPDRLPPSGLTALRNMLAEAAVTLSEGVVAEQKLRELRKMYEPYVHALSEYFLLPLPPWFRVTDKPDDWQTSPWEKLLAEVAAPRTCL